MMLCGRIIFYGAGGAGGGGGGRGHDREPDQHLRMRGAAAATRDLHGREGGREGGSEGEKISAEKHLLSSASFRAHNRP